MRISYYSPKKNIKLLSFSNLKPVLLFTSDKKELTKDKENIIDLKLKTKLFSENIISHDYEHGNLKNVSNKINNLLNGK